MLSLNHVLHGQDLAFLEELERLWALPCHGKDAAEKAKILTAKLSERAFASEILALLPAHALEALQTLKALGGQMHWSAFTRDYGPLRPMGPGKLKRERPGFFSISTTEQLWYRGLIGRAFLGEGDQLAEFAFLPEEFASLIPPRADAQESSLPERAQLSVSDPGFNDWRSLDELCTLLSSLRRPDKARYLEKAGLTGTRLTWLESLARAAGLTEGKLPTENARFFLELERTEAWRWLVQTWSVSRKFDELRLSPSWICQGTWINDSTRPRKTLLALLTGIGHFWVSFDTLIAWIRLHLADFLRSGADYDTWLISSQTQAVSLRGVSHWDELEAKFIREFISETLYRLGLVELDSETQPVCFRPSAWWPYLMGTGIEEAPALPEFSSNLTYSPSGKLAMDRFTPALARYQLSRFGEILENGPDQFAYQLTPQSLKIASRQGLKVSHLVSLLRKYARTAPSPSFLKLLHRWEENGREAWVDRPYVLHLPDPATLQSLRESKLSGVLGETLGPATVIVKQESLPRLRSGLARLGLLLDQETEND